MVNRRIVLYCTAFLVGFAGLCTGAHAASLPPQDLHLEGDHWTAWYPPAAFPDGAQIYTIRSGDTLWDLANRFYSNPYLWPQIWEANQYILDAHWIYPGDPLVVGMKVVTPDELADGSAGDDPFATDGDDGVDEPVDASEVVGVLSLEEALGPPEALGSSSDIYCSGFIGDLEEDFGYSIVGTEYDALNPQLSGGLTEYREDRIRDTSIYGGSLDTLRYGVSSGDVVYVDGGRDAGLSAGQLFTAVEAGDRVEHPITGETFGRYYQQLGRLRVLSVQENSAIAEVTGEVCGRITVGAKLRRFEPEPVPLGRRGLMRPLNYPSPAEALEDAPVILHSDDSVISIGSDHIVHIDRGSEDDVVQGDLFTVYRVNKPGLPPLILGEVAVLSVSRHSAVVRVLETRFPIFVGDRLELK